MLPLLLLFKLLQSIIFFQMAFDGSSACEDQTQSTHGNTDIQITTIKVK